MLQLPLCFLIYDFNMFFYKEHVIVPHCPSGYAGWGFLGLASWCESDVRVIFAAVQWQLTVPCLDSWGPFVPPEPAMFTWPVLDQWSPITFLCWLGPQEAIQTWMGKISMWFCRVVCSRPALGWWWQSCCTHWLLCPPAVREMPEMNGEIRGNLSLCWSIIYSIWNKYIFHLDKY